MNDDFSKLDALLRETAAQPPGSAAPDLRAVVAAEIARRRAAPTWRRWWAGFRETGPVEVRPAYAAFALAAALVIGIMLPARLDKSPSDAERVSRALNLQSFGQPASLWGTEP